MNKGEVRCETATATLEENKKSGCGIGNRSFSI